MGTILVKFVHNGPIDNITAQVQKIAWRWTGDKPLSESMVGQWIDPHMHHSASFDIWRWKKCYRLE